LWGFRVVANGIFHLKFKNNRGILKVSIKNVNQYPISQLFNTDSKVVFEIPKYQREYSWGSKNWEDLFDDLLDNQDGYFLGTIICIDTSIDTINAPKREVVDGQQRLTTISLLLCALYSSIAQYEKELNDEQKMDFSQLKRKLVLKNTSSNIRVIPQSQNNNLEDYKGVLAEQKIILPSLMPKFAGKRRVKKAFEYFKKRILKTIDEKEQDALTTLFEILEKINSSVMVMIEVLSHTAAYTLFESLNYRGTPLTAIDLIKNLLLAKLDLEKKDSIDYYFNRWQEILESIGDDYAVQERFFRHNYNAFRRSLNKPFICSNNTRQFPLGALATRSNLLYIYESVISKDPHVFLDELINNAKLYSRIIVRDDDILSTLLCESYQSLARVQGTPSYLLLLYLEKEKLRLNIADSDITDVVQFMVTFFVRRNLTDAPPTRDLTKMFMDIIDEIEQNEVTGQQIMTTIKEKLASSLASDTVFQEKLRGAIYSDNHDMTRFILCKIAESGMTRETAVDLWKRNHNGIYIWTIEHIFPQGASISQAWVDMIADGDQQKAKEAQSQYVHTFGNLTITGYNSTLSNKPFSEKRDRKDSNGNFIGYKNGLNLNCDIATENSWTIDKIENRTDALVDKILLMFKL
jgi:uncharacterized protein YeaO (DUF488 family)